jgi:hypothetical protein
VRTSSAASCSMRGSNVCCSSCCSSGSPASAAKPCCPAASQAASRSCSGRSVQRGKEITNHCKVDARIVCVQECMLHHVRDMGKAAVCLQDSPYCNSMTASTAAAELKPPAVLSAASTLLFQ